MRPNPGPARVLPARDTYIGSAMLRALDKPKTSTDGLRRLARFMGMRDGKRTSLGNVREWLRVNL